MKCEQKNLNGFSFEACAYEAEEFVWCPTWVNQTFRPMALCQHHAKNFKPEFNPHAKDGIFFWGDKAFEEANKARN